MKFIEYVIKPAVIIFAVTFCFTLLSCEHTSQPPDAVRIGLLAYTEDEHRESMGLPTVNAAQMAVAEINRAGGVKLAAGQVQVELVVNGVVASSPQNAVAAFRKLSNLDKVSAVVGLHYSVDAIPAGIFAEKARIPFISPMSTHSSTTKNRNYVFRMSFVDEFQGSVMARFAFHDLGSRRAAVLFDRTDPYSAGIAEVFSTTYLDLGGAVVSWQPFVHEQVDYDEVVEQIKDANPDIIYLPGFSVDVAKQVEVVRAHGLDARLLGADGWDMQAFAQNPLFDNSYATSHWFKDVKFTGSARFVDNYIANYGQTPDAVAALTYDAMHLLFSALEFGGSNDGETLQKALVNMDAYAGVSGAVDFVGSGDPEKGVVVLQLIDKSISLKRIVEKGEY